MDTADPPDQLGCDAMLALGKSSPGSGALPSGLQIQLVCRYGHTIASMTREAHERLKYLWNLHLSLTSVWRSQGSHWSSSIFSISQDNPKGFHKFGALLVMKETTPKLKFLVFLSLLKKTTKHTTKTKPNPIIISDRH